MDLLSKLAELLTSPPNAIEVIPGDGQEWLESYPDNPHAPFLFVEGNLGVPEKVIYKAYMAAVKRLGEPKKYLRSLLQTDDRDMRKARGDAMAITSVILLANPGHQTALNIRKTLIFDLSSKDETAEACVTELHFISALLSVKQCSKVSMLWHHRWTLLTSILKHVSPDEGLTDERQLHFEECDILQRRDFLVSTLQGGFDLASRASEIYPRNYFAWYHRLLCFRAALESYVRLQSRLERGIPLRVTPTYLFNAKYNDSEEEIAAAKSAAKDFENVLTCEFTSIKSWVERHVSDYSAVDYLCKICEALDDAPPSTMQTSQQGSEFLHAPYTNDLARHALKLVQSYACYGTLWLYLRRALHMLIHTGEPSVVLSFAEEVDSFARKAITDAAKKCESQSEVASKLINHEVHAVSKHALRFLIWRRAFQLNKSDKLPDLELLELACPHYRFWKGRPAIKLSSDQTALLLQHISSVE